MTNQNKTITLFEAFAGIGSQLRALSNVAPKYGYEVKPIGVIEWYLDALLSYQMLHFGKLPPEEILSKEEMLQALKGAVFSSNSKSPVAQNYFNKLQEDKLRQIFPYLQRFLNTGNNFSDITKVTTLPANIDIFTYSFPCQDLSTQGKQRGIIPGSKSGLLLEIKRLLETNLERLPKVLIMENVKALSQAKFAAQFQEWIQDLDKLGYTSSFQVCNAAHYGSTQNRERLFLISWRKAKLFSFPEPKQTKKDLSDIISFHHDPKLDVLIPKLQLPFKTTKQAISKAWLNNHTKFNSENWVYLPTGTGPTLTASGANSRLKFWVNHKLQYLNASEAYQYMGFTKQDASLVASSALISEAKMIYTCGNSISVEVLEAIFSALLEQW